MALGQNRGKRSQALTEIEMGLLRKSPNLGGTANYLFVPCIYARDFFVLVYVLKECSKTTFCF
jgi:hypothetical protein